MRTRALASILGTVVLAGCSAVLGDHPFSSAPKSDFGKPAKFSPGASLYTALSITPQVYAVDWVLRDGKRLPVKFVTVFVRINTPRGPWEGATVNVTVTDGTVYRMPAVPDHAWSLEGPFGIGRHDLKVEVLVDGAPVYERELHFTVYPAPAPAGTVR